MSLLSPASEVLQRHQDEFLNKNVLFAGDLQDDFCAKIDAKSVNVHCQYYHQWLRLTQYQSVQAEFGLLPSATLTTACELVVFYWYKNKSESHFQLMGLLSQLSLNCPVLIVGENRTGVRSVEKKLVDYGSLTKIDTARRCSLYYFERTQVMDFELSAWWQTYQVTSININMLPGVFSHGELDAGSALLLSVLTAHPEWLHGEVLDMGCGAGVLSTKAATLVPHIHLTLCDTSAAALASSEATLAENGLTGNVIASDLFSAIKTKFDVIITNPPFHEGRQVTLSMTQRLIQGAKQHLNHGGALILVANAFLPYADWLDEVFGHHEVVAQNTKFKVYRVQLSSHNIAH